MWSFDKKRMKKKPRLTVNADRKTTVLNQTFVELQVFVLISTALTITTVIKTNNSTTYEHWSEWVEHHFKA